MFLFSGARRAIKVKSGLEGDWTYSIQSRERFRTRHVATLRRILRLLFTTRLWVRASCRTDVPRLWSSSVTVFTNEVRMDDKVRARLRGGGLLADLYPIRRYALLSPPNRAL